MIPFSPKRAAVSEKKEQQGLHSVKIRREMQPFPFFPPGYWHLKLALANGDCGKKAERLEMRTKNRTSRFERRNAMYSDTPGGEQLLLKKQSDVPCISRFH